jgi:hypothetical protein
LVAAAVVEPGGFRAGVIGDLLGQLQGRKGHASQREFRTREAEFERQMMRAQRHASQREFLTREAEFERQMMKFFITNIRKRKYA